MRDESHRRTPNADSIGVELAVILGVGKPQSDLANKLNYAR